MSQLFFKKLLFALLSVALISFIILFHYPSLLILGLLALCFGLRHGLDADHILAIDNVTRKLHSDNQTAYSAGTFFALGHSTIVFLLTVGIIFGVSSIHSHFVAIQKMGMVIGSVISAVFLWITAGMNIYALVNRKSMHAHFVPKGFLASLFKPVFQSISKPWKMYFVGFLFGLGLDTATEVGLLSISAASALQGFHASVILLFPVLFSVGMVLTDSCDALFMSSVYRSTAIQTYHLQFYYKLIIVVATILAIFIGFSELMTFSPLSYTNLFMLINTHFEWIGASIVIFFSILFLLAKRKLFT